MPAKPPTKVKIRARLCPHRSLADKPADPTWPCPEGVTVELTPQGGKSAARPLNPTDSDGETSGDLEAGMYTPKLAADQAAWKGWECTGPVLAVSADEAEQTFDVRLVPPGDRRLLAVRLVRRRDRDDGADGLDTGNIQVIKGRDFDEKFGPAGDAGYIYAWAPSGNVRVRFSRWIAPDNEIFDPVYPEVTFSVPGPSHRNVSVAELGYRPALTQVMQPVAPAEGAKISIAPKVMMPSGSLMPFTGASVAVNLHPDSAEPVSLEGTLGTGEKVVSFENQPAGVFGGLVIPPDTLNGWPVRESSKPIATHYLPAGESVTASVSFTLDKTHIDGRVFSPLGTPLADDLNLEIFCPGMRPVAVTARKGTFTADVPTGAPLKIRLAHRAEPRLDGVPLKMDPADQDVLPPPQVTTVALVYEHAILGQAVDELGNPMPYAVVDVFDGPDKIASVVADQDGFFVAGLRHGGSFIVAVQTEGGEPVTGKPVTISSSRDIGKVGPRPRRALNGSPPQSGDGLTVTGPASGRPGSGGTGGGGAGANGSGSQVREAFTDLAAYPVLTEEVSTTGPPAPAAGGFGGGAGAGYGQVVDQVIRDVLGWRPGGDVAGFQAALTGAFQLREVEGHTEWSWQQRGYAVQADMGALTGAQASIYARAKSALDQTLPLLAGLTSLNPALWPEQDREAIRAVVGAELQELVGELALEGGPRIQRVDELFGLLLGESTGSTNLNPDIVQGQLGILRDRFALTVEWIETVDDERVATNFRIIVEQILALQASWSTDRNLLSVVDSRTSLGTILIWLSRGLEAVCESVDDLTFALDSVYIDAAQRQVIELRFGSEPPLLLSDLLDWVVRASRDEGPRLIQDAGRDGVRAFAPVLGRLHGLIRQTIQVARDPSLPPGMATPRVTRALQVLDDQLGEATRLAGLVQYDQAPRIDDAWVIDPGTGRRHTLAEVSGRTIQVQLEGSNFRPGASAVLVPRDEGLADVPARNIRVTPPNGVSAVFRNPRTLPGGANTIWSVLIINQDGTQSGDVSL